MSWRAKAGALLGAMALTVLPVGSAHAQDPDGVLVTMGGPGRAAHWTDVTLFGGPVVVPGDTGATTLRVHNSGPTAATLTASAVDTTLSDPNHEDDLYDVLLVNGVPASRLAEQETVLHRVTVPQGGTVDLPFTYELPLTASGNSALADGARGVSFRVHLQLTGEPADAGPDSDGVRSETGGAVVPRRLWPFAVAGAAAAVALVAARGLRRREQSP